MAKAKFLVQMAIVIEYDEDAYTDAEEAANLFIQEADYSFKYPVDTIKLVKSEIFDQTTAESVFD